MLVSGLLQLAAGWHPLAHAGAQVGLGVEQDELGAQPAPIHPLPGPDFSFSGRGSAAQEPPPVTPATHVYFDVTDFGAIPDDGGSDRAAVEAAIAAAEAHGGPAVVWFPAGRFVLRGEDDVGADSIRIRRSELVLKGAGMYSGGTELFLASESEDAYAFQFWPELDPSVGWRGAGTLTELAEIPRRGQREVEVADASGVFAGDVVRLRGVLPDTFPEFRRFFDPLGDEALIQSFFDDSSGAGKDWRSDFLSTLEVESVNGDTVRFKEPLQADYEFVSPTYGGGPELVQIFAEGDELLHDVGVEDLAFVSDYRDNFKHFFNRAADGYNFLQLDDVRESWVRRVRMRSGTRGIVFGKNGRGNVVYDVLFEGNSGHYSVTSAGNFYGNQASFLREAAPVHHGFGATSSSFSTVFHRCNQFGGPEGHGGYPQATLYDLNEGDLSLPRVGGAPPHQSKFTVFWNWKQSLFVPSNSGVYGPDGRYISTSLEGGRLDFWPALIMRPFVVGLHGVPLEIADATQDLELLLYPGQRVLPESLFEEQLRARLGAVPGWLRTRAQSFEEVSRYSQVDIGSPANDTVSLEGEPLHVGVRLHPRFDRDHLARVELHASRGHDLDFPEQVVASSTAGGVQSLAWTPPAAGAWRVRLVLVNSLLEESWSEPLYVFVQPLRGAVTYADAVAAWLQPRSLDGRAIQDSSDAVVYVSAEQYRADVRAIEEPQVRPAVDDPSNRQVGQELIDGNLTKNATGPAALRWYGNKGLVLDLGSVQPVHFIQLVAPAGAQLGQELFGAFDVQVSPFDQAQYSYTNSDFTWRTVRRMGHARASAKLPLDGARTYRIHLPAGTQARYVRLAIRTLDSPGPNDGNLAELRCGTVAGV